MKFFEVFDMLTVDSGLKEVFEEVVATKVAASNCQDVLQYILRVII